MLTEAGEKSPHTDLLPYEDEACVYVSNLITEATLIIPGYGVNENNFGFDELFALICQTLAFSLLQDVIFWTHARAKSKCVEIFQIHSSQMLLRFSPPASGSLFLNYLYGNFGETIHLKEPISMAVKRYGRFRSE